MKIIRTEGRLFEHILPLVKEQENLGLVYLRDEDDGTIGEAGRCCYCCKRVYFNDGKNAVAFEDRTRKFQ
jgi:hypothetical protein